MARTRLLDPTERFAEILFGLLMVLTFTGTLSVTSAGREDVRDMLIGALGCNLAWGIVDAVMYLINTFTLRMRGILLLRRVRAAKEDVAAEIIAGALPDAVAEVLGPDDLRTIHGRLSTRPELARRGPLRKGDFLAATGVLLLVFLATFPVTIPFMLVKDVMLAKRMSNGIALIMLYVLGDRVGRYAGWKPWLMGMAMLFLGFVLVAIIIALGG